MTIGCQRVGETADILKLPLRVLPIHDLLKRACRRESAIIAHDMATTRRESAVRFKMSCDFAIETPPPSPDITKQLARLDLDEEELKRATAAPSLDDSAVSTGEDAGAVASAPDDVSTGAEPKTPTKASQARARGVLSRMTPAGGTERYANPFVKVVPRDVFARETLLHAISSLARRKSSRNFQIHQAGIVFHLTKPVFKLGEDVIGRFDFSASSAPCYQVSVTLELLEQIDGASWKLAKAPDGTTPATYEVHAERSVFCRDLSDCTVMLPIPLVATPDFDTDVVSVKWRLSFMFVIAKNPEEGAGAKSVLETTLGTIRFAADSVPVRVRAADTALPRPQCVAARSKGKGRASMPFLCASGTDNQMHAAPRSPFFLVRFLGMRPWKWSWKVFSGICRYRSCRRSLQISLR